MDILITSALGIGTVFVGLICIIALVEIMHYFMTPKTQNEGQSVSAPAPTPAAQNAQIANRGEVVAAISAAVAEELGTDVKAIRITSIKRI